MHLGVGRERDLEPSVEGEPVDTIGAHPTPDAVGGLEHPHRDAGIVQRDGARQSGEAGADDDDWFVGDASLAEQRVQRRREVRDAGT